MEFVKPTESFNDTCPDFDAPESVKENPEWSKQYLRWIFTHYNRPFPTWNADATTENYLPVERGILNSLYYIGKQRNINYNHLTLDTNGNSLPVTWVKSKKVKPLIDRLCGDLIKQLGAKEISATSLSKRAKSEKMAVMEREMTQFDNRFQRVFDAIEERSGVRPVFALADKYNSQEEAENYFTYSFKDDLEEVATDIGRYVEFANDFDTTMIEAFRQDFCPANYMAVYYYVENGKLKTKRVPFYNLVMDISSDDPFMRDGKFCAVLERLTTQEIFKRFPNLPPNKKQEIRQLEKDGEFRDGFFNFYNQGGVMDWWTYRRNDVTALCMTGYWVCQRDSGRSPVRDSYGNYKYVKSEKKGEVIYDLYKATMVGNCYLVDHGYDDNVVRSTGNKADPEMPVKIFQGNTTLGEGISPIGLCTDLVDLMDAMDYKIREMMGKHKGKGYWINGNKLSGASKEFIQEMSTLGITVGYPSGEGTQADNQPPVYPIDMGLDDSIIKYAEYAVTLERRMEAYLSLNPSVLGLQNTQVGLGVQKNNVAMSTAGNMGLFRNLFKFNEICLQYSINLFKIVYGRGNHDEIANLVTGDRGLKVMEIIQKRLFEDVLVKISPKDVVTDDVKNRIHMMSQAFAQSGQMSKLDWLRTETAETITQLYNDWEKAEINAQRREDARMQADRDAKLQAIQANNEGQLQTVTTQDQTKKEIATQGNIAKVAVADMKQKS